MGLCLLLPRFAAPLAGPHTRRLIPGWHGAIVGLLGHVFYCRVRNALNQSFDGVLNRPVKVGINLPAHALHFFGDCRRQGALYRVLRTPLDPWSGFPHLCEGDGRRMNGLLRVGWLRINRDYQFLVLGMWKPVLRRGVDAPNISSDIKLNSDEVKIPEGTRPLHPDDTAADDARRQLRIGIRNLKRND